MQWDFSGLLMLLNWPCNLSKAFDKIREKIYHAFVFEPLRTSYVKGGFIMPTYELVCEKCNKPFTLDIKVSEYEKKNSNAQNAKAAK